MALFVCYFEENYWRWSDRLKTYILNLADLHHKKRTTSIYNTIHHFKTWYTCKAMQKKRFWLTPKSHLILSFSVWIYFFQIHTHFMYILISNSHKYLCMNVLHSNLLFPNSMLWSLLWSYRSMLKMHFYLHEHFPEKACSYIPSNMTLFSIGLTINIHKIVFQESRLESGILDLYHVQKSGFQLGCI